MKEIPTLTISNIDLSESEDYGVIFSQNSDSDYDCTLCKSRNDTRCTYDEYDPENIFNVCSELSVVCPKCAVLDHESKTFKAYHMFIEKVIYIQDDEMDMEPDVGDNDIQNKWYRIEKIDDSTLDKFRLVDKEYQSYGLDNLAHSELEHRDYLDPYYQDLWVSCVCKNCGFECSGRNYQDS
jgi:hypothetical protein